MSADRRHEISMSRPSIGEAGDTGDWRSRSPVLVPADCYCVQDGADTCAICWAHCPDACISRTVPPVIDYDHCKGCGICVQVCPSGALVGSDCRDPRAEEGAA